MIFIDVCLRNTYYINTIARCYLKLHLAQNLWNMQERKAAGFVLEIFVVVAILGTLSAIAIPRVGQMMAKTEAIAQESELHNIQTAVVEMLHDSDTHTLEPVGPTTDMNEVLTSDTPPLILADYLDKDGGSLSSGCSYTFDAQGNVTQTLP